MNNTCRSLSLLGVSILLLAGCDFNGEMIRGSGTLATQKRTVGEFSGLDLQGAYKVVIRCGQEQAVEVSGDDNILPHVRTEVEGGILKVRTDRSLSTRNAIRVSIAMKNIESVRISGASDIDLSGLDGKTLAIDVSGTANIKARGRTDVLQVKMSGAGGMEAKDLQAKRADVRISGTGHIVLSVSDGLNASVSGVGNIDYYGNPGEVVENVSGVGKIRKRYEGKE